MNKHLFTITLLFTTTLQTTINSTSQTASLKKIIPTSSFSSEDANLMASIKPDYLEIVYKKGEIIKVKAPFIYKTEQVNGNQVAIYQPAMESFETPQSSNLKPITFQRNNRRINTKIKYK